MAERRIIMQKRNSSIELLKIIALFFIVISHISLTAVKFKYNAILSTDVFFDIATVNSIETGLVLFFRNFGSIGNTIFVVCSAYFLSQSKKSRVDSILKIIFDCWVISYTALIIYLLICSAANQEPLQEAVAMSLLPITKKANWFICCYILMVFVHPLLNTLLEKLESKKLLFMTVVMFFIYYVVSFFEIPILYYSEAMVFFINYIIVGLIRKSYNWIFENKKISASLTAVGFIGLIITFVAMGFYGDEEIYVGSNAPNNPFILIFAIGVFGLFKDIKLSNSGINKISSLSLFVYLLHENYVFRICFRPSLYAKACEITSGNYRIAVILVMSIIIFIASILIGWLYSVSIGRITNALSKKTYGFIRKIYSEAPKLKK